MEKVGYNRLTRREREVLILVAQGATNREIANNLFISTHTVKVHLHNILTKLHARNRQVATARAVTESLEKQFEQTAWNIPPASSSESTRSAVYLSPASTT